ncbi:metal-binding protein [Proteus hauseri]|nr:metal-binding protein [Proteus hauseri]
MKKLLLPTILALSAFTGATHAATKNIVEVYKTETCGCCTLWADGIEEAGFNVKVNIVSEAQLMQKYKQAGVPANLLSCHLATYKGKDLVGHIPVDSLKNIDLVDKSKTGIAVAGMPAGSLGMYAGDYKEPYQVIAFDKAGDQAVFKSYN